MSAAPKTIHYAVAEAYLTSVNRRPLNPLPKVPPIPVVYLITALCKKLGDMAARTPFAVLIFDFVNPYTDQSIAPINTLLNFVRHPRPINCFGTNQYGCNTRPLKC